ncbi:MAG: alpha,alpha-trehalase [archaeon]|nr:MAG: alpha,alpha-trehalase [archaeon]
MDTGKDYKKCLRYIEDYWKKSTFYLPKDRGVYIGMPNPFVSANGTRFHNDQFYWDSYFIILGLVESGKIRLAKGMVDNFIYLFEKFGRIPSRNRYYNLGISQLPFLTSMIMEIFSKTKDKKWLRKAVKTAEKELKNYWMNKDEVSGEIHLVYRGLSRYCDHYVTHHTSEYESGWDITSRFNDHCLDYLPVDLNSCLYKYERDIAEIYHITGSRTKQRNYLGRADKRRKTVNKLMWNKKKGFFFDYDYKKKKQSNFYSVAGFYPLWANLASKEQAERVRENLRKFEYKGGLANTQKTGLSKEFKQHDYPNGWANQQWIVIRGLLNYGFEEDAKRLATKWLEMNRKVFLRTGKFWEKYNVVKCDVGKEGRYPNQTGFGWTNGVFVKLISEFF